MAESHIAVLHVVACRATEGRSIAQEAARLTLTVRMYYRGDGNESWQHIFVIAEGPSADIAMFIAWLKRRDTLAADSEQPALMTGVSLLLRQWSYLLPALPTERTSWGYDEWMKEAERELQEYYEQQGQEAAEAGPSEAAQAETRHLGPPGIKGAAYRSFKELIFNRLEKLGLGCDWNEVVTVAQLSAASAERTEENPGTPRHSEQDASRSKRSRRAAAPSTEAGAVSSCNMSSGDGKAAVSAPAPSVPVPVAAVSSRLRDLRMGFDAESREAEAQPDL